MSQPPFGSNPQNPYPPQQRPTGPAPGARPIDKVKIPAILLMVAGSIGVLMHLLGILMNLLGVGAGAAAQGGGNDAQMLMVQGTAGIVAAIIGLAFDGFVIFGASNMMKLRGWGMSLATAIIAMLPCISCGCFLGIPIGIWAIVVLSDANVKNAFK